MGLFFLYFRLFNSTNKFYKQKFADNWIRIVDLWYRKQATALPTVPQPLPISLKFWDMIILYLLQVDLLLPGHNEPLDRDSTLRAADRHLSGEDLSKRARNKLWPRCSVTRFGDLLDFGQLFKAFSNNSFAQISHILRQYLYRCKKPLIFLVKSFLGNFYRLWQLFTCHTAKVTFYNCNFS